MPFLTSLQTGAFPTGKRCSLIYIVAFTVMITIASQARATQEGWPALFDVTGVAADDVLNVRTEPDPESEIIGTLAHDATDVEVVAPNDAETWGLTNIGELSGWVSLSFLARQPGHLDGLYPEFTACFGTEPFWSLAREGGTLTLDVAFDDRPALAELVDWETGTLNHRGRFSFGSQSMIGVVSRQSCNDGMSDMEFGLDIDLILPREQFHLQGCCSIAPR